MPLSNVDATGIVSNVASGATGGALGFLVALVTFRTKLAVQDSAIKQLGIDLTREVAGLKEEISRLSDSVDRRHDGLLRDVNRRLDMLLRIVVANARATHTDKRLDDTFIRLLAEADQAGDRDR